MNTGRVLRQLAALFVTVVIGSWLGARFAAPDLLRIWGYLLAVVLFVWVGASIWVLLPSVRSARWPVLAILGLAVATGMLVPMAGFIALFVLVVGLAAVILLAVAGGISRLLRRPLPTQLLLLGYVPMLAALVTLGVAIAAHWGPPVPAHPTNVSDELRGMAAMDQIDRYTGHFVLNANRDHARLRRVHALDQQGLMTTPADQYHAALILQHGECPSDWHRAYELAYAAAQANYPDPEELWKGAYDRWMLSLGQPAKYGTQLSIAVSPQCALVQSSAAPRQ